MGTMVSIPLRKFLRAYGKDHGVFFSPSFHPSKEVFEVRPSQEKKPVIHSVSIPLRKFLRDGARVSNGGRSRVSIPLRKFLRGPSGNPDQINLGSFHPSKEVFEAFL